MASSCGLQCVLAVALAFQQGQLWVGAVVVLIVGVVLQRIEAQLLRKTAAVGTNIERVHPTA